MNEYLRNSQKERCCGCYACAAKCPKGCIQLIPDEEGFFYPIIDKTKCVNCGICSQVCPFEQTNKNTREFVQAYAAHSKNNRFLINSSSGGVFSELATRFLRAGGYVCGATIDEEHRVFHIVINSENDLPLLQGSKYVQSCMDGVWNQIGSLLNSGKRVLFSGTPCQVSAVKNMFHSDRLFTIDVLCHGVPSQKLFDQYVTYLEEKHKGALIGIWFRDKEKYGWSITQKYTIRKRHGKEKSYYLDRHLSEYFSGFLRNMTQRESCFNCPYTTIERAGDLTLADFWGIEKVHPELCFKEGTSLVLVNNENGYNLLFTCSDSIVINSVTIGDALVQNPNFEKPPTRDSHRDKVYKDVAMLGFGKIGKKYLLPTNSYKYRIASLIGMNGNMSTWRKKK